MDTLRMSIEGPSSSLDAVCRIILYCGFFSNRGYSAGAGLDTWTPGHTLNVSIECPSYSLDAVCCIPRLLLQQRVFCGWQAWVLDPSLSEARTITWSRQHQRWILYRGIPHRAGNSFLNGYLRASWSISLRLDQTFTLIFTGTNLGLCLLFWPCSGVWILATINWQVHIWYKLHHNAILWWYSCMLLGRLR